MSADRHPVPDPDPVANLVPVAYRGVAVAGLPRDVPVTPDGLRTHFLGRPAYRRTRFVVARSAGRTALLRVTRESETELFSPIESVAVLAGPDECVYLVDPELDTGIPSALAGLAIREAPGARAVVVEGRYAHVSFIVAPRPLRIAVHDVVPPRPAKLADQARRVLEFDETLPPIELAVEVTDLADLARRRPAEHYLLPCRGSGADVPGARISYLDEHPERADWTLLGCARSRQIHRAFYGDEPPTVDFCPRQTGPPGSGPLLTKCCLQENGIESGDDWVSVPWGASLEQVRQALTLLAAREVPAWAPG